MNFNWFSLLYYQKTNTIIQILWRAINQSVLQVSRSWALEPFPSRITVALLNERRVLTASLEQNDKNKIQSTKWKPKYIPVGGKEEEKSANYSLRLSCSHLFALNNVINLYIIICTLHFPFWLIFKRNHCHVRALGRITMPSASYCITFIILYLIFFFFFIPFYILILACLWPAPALFLITLNALPALEDGFSLFNSNLTPKCS